MAAIYHQPTTYVPGKVSVVGAYYNRARFVKPAVDSLLSQDYKDFEIVLVDDGSSDSTLGELRAFNDSRVRVVTQENLGFVRSIRRAIGLTDGEYISIHGSGDLVDTSLLDRQIAVLRDAPTIGLVGVWTYNENLHLGSKRFVKPTSLSGDAFESLLQKTGINHGGSMFRRCLYDKVGGYRTVFTYAQDHDLFLRLSEMSGVQVIQEPLYTRLQIPGGVSVTPAKRARQRSLQRLAIHCARERRAGRPDPVDEYGEAALLLRPRSRELGNRYASMAVERHDACDAEWARNFVRIALNERPSPKYIAIALAIRIANSPKAYGPTAARLITAARYWRS